MPNFLALVLLVAAIGCSKSRSEEPIPVTATEVATPEAPTEKAAPEEALPKEAAPKEAAPKEAAPEDTSIVVTIQEGDGELAQLLSDHVAKAKQANLAPYLEFSADWCPPCVEFKRYLKDPMMQDALTGTYIIIVDYDGYGAEASAMNVIGIPTWLELDEQGKPTGRRLTSSVWEEDIPVNMAPPLKAFFADQAN